MSHAEQFAQQWKAQRDVLEGVLASIPDGQEGFKPWEGAMSLGELALHAGTSAKFFAQIAATGEFARPTVEATSMAEIRQAVHELTEQTMALLVSISDERWAQSVDMTPVLGRAVEVSGMLYGMRDHEIHHKGQLFVYARMAGAKDLPMFTKFA